MNRNELYYDLLKSLIIAAVVQFFNRYVFSRFSLESIALIQALLIMVFTVSCYIVLDHLIKTDKGKMISKIVILIVVLATSIASYLLISKFILQLDDGTAVYIGKLNEQYKTHMIESGKTMLEMWKSFDHNLMIYLFIED